MAVTNVMNFLLILLLCYCVYKNYFAPAIARAFLKECSVILLDEATSALDNISQQKVQDAIYNAQRYSAKKSRKVIMIAHRLSTIKNADRIFFLKDGVILASGTHEELLTDCAIAPWFMRLGLFFV